MNLYEKIQAIGQKIKNLEKDMVVNAKTPNAYKALSDLRVVLEVKEAEQEVGIVSIPYKQELISEKQVTAISGGKEKLYNAHTIKMTTKFVNVEKPDEFIEVESFGYGWDTGDKGLGKASTYARKYALLNAYKIASGEDPDKDPSQQDEPLGIDARVKALNECYADRQEDLEKVLSHFKVNSLADLNAIDLDTVYKTVQKRGWLDV